MAKEKERQEEINDTFRKVCAGDMDAFKVLFDEFYPKLCWFAGGYLGSEESADEVVKELFLYLWQKRKEIKISVSANAYLYASVRNRSINYLRAKKNIGKNVVINMLESEDLALFRAPAADPSEEMEQKELAAEIDRAIASLPGRMRLVFTLKREEGLSYNEIAEVLEISSKTVENQMVKAFKILRKELTHLLPLIALLTESVRKVI